MRRRTAVGSAVAGALVLSAGIAVTPVLAQTVHSRRQASAASAESPAASALSPAGLTATTTAAPAPTPSGSRPPRATPTPTPVVAGPATRDPRQWPFSRQSIWNTPIGSGARYVNTGLTSGGFGVDTDWFVITKKSDPKVPTYMAATFGEGRCAGTTAQQQAPWHPESTRPQYVPRDLVIPDAVTHGGIYSTPNSTSAFLQPDGKTLVNYNVTARCQKGSPLYGQWFGETSLYGDGIAGGHGGSGMSSIGGDIRTGELFGSDPIRHALKVEIWGKYMYYDTATGGKRWPAQLADGAAPQTYQGKVKAVRMGALFALPPSVTAKQLGVTSAAGRKLFDAMQNFGGYLVDDTGLDAVALCVEHQAQVQYQQRTGHDVAQDPALQREFARIMRAAKVVDNNAKNQIGGPGTRRAALAPPFA